MPPTIDALIRARIEEFADELSALVKQAAVETVQDALSGGTARARRRGPGRPRKTTAASRKPGRPRGTKATKATTTAGKRIRRTAEDLDALAGKVLTFVRSNAGARMEEISAGLGVQTKDLGRPVASLLEGTKLRTEGQRRGTRYYSGGSKSTSPKASKKTGKRKVGKRAKRRGRGKTVPAVTLTAA